jgi:gamma-glutamyltranspeptidase
MTKDGILLNNAMANFAIPNESGSLTTANQLVEGRRPLTSNVVALTMDTKTICGSRIGTIHILRKHLYSTKLNLPS